MTRASFWRRSLAAGLEAVPGLALTAALMWLGVLPDATFRPPPDWFGTDWLVQLWIERVDTLLSPGVWCMVLSTAASAAMEFGGMGPSRWLGLEVVDARGRRPDAWRFGLRLLGACLNTATLGLGYLWALASRHGRGWNDIISGTSIAQTNPRHTAQ